MVRLNSPTLDTTKLMGGDGRWGDTEDSQEGETYLVPSSVQLMNWADLESLIILREEED